MHESNHKKSACRIFFLKALQGYMLTCLYQARKLRWSSGLKATNSTLSTSLVGAGIGSNSIRNHFCRHTPSW